MLTAKALQMLVFSSTLMVCGATGQETPVAHVAPQASQDSTRWLSITLKDKRVIVGMVVEETDDRLRIVSGERTYDFPKSFIKSQTPSSSQFESPTSIPPVSPATTSSKTKPTSLLSLPKKIQLIVSRPFLRFEQVQDESVLPAEQFNGDQLEGLVVSVVQEVFTSRNLVMAGLRLSPSDTISEANEKVFNLSPELSQGVVEEEAYILLKQLGNPQESQAVLVQYVRAKVGQGGSWNPFSGGITSSSSSTQIYAALIDCASGKVLWKNRVLLRDLPSTENMEFRESIEALFRTFPTRKEE